MQFVVSKYKAMGAASFVVKIDDYLPELLRMFVSKCGFSQISYEKLWKINHAEEIDVEKGVREFRNSDSPTVSTLFNESLLPHFRPLLSKDAKEFREVFFKGLSYFNEYKYIIENKKSGNIVCYISIQTSDNENYIIDVIQSSWAEIDMKYAIDLAFTQIKKRQKNFNLFIKTKKYTQLGEKYEQDFINNKFECIQNQVVLTNSSARIIKQTEHTGRFVMLNQFCGSSPLCRDL